MGFEGLGAGSVLATMELWILLIEFADKVTAMSLYSRLTLTQVSAGGYPDGRESGIDDSMFTCRYVKIIRATTGYRGIFNGMETTTADVDTCITFTDCI